MKRFSEIILSPWSLIIAVSVLEILVAFSASWQLTFDEAIWHYIGRNWFRYGMVPYSGGVDNKSPFIYMIYGTSDLLFGINYWFPRLLAIISQVIGLYFVYRITKHLADNKAGILAIIFYGLSLTWKSTDGNFVSQAQAYEVTFLIIAFYYYFTGTKTRHFFLAGIIAGIAIAFKLTAALPSLIIFPALFYRNNNQSAFAYAFGLLISMCLAAVLFLLLGIDLHDLVVYSLSDNFTPGSVTDHPFAWKVRQFINQFIYSEMILFYPFLIVSFFIKRKIHVLLWWLIASFASLCIIGMFARSHIKELLPPLSIISAISLLFLIEKYRVSIRYAVIVLVLIFFPRTLNPFIDLENILSNNYSSLTNKSDDQLKQQLGLWIRSNTKPAEKVYIAGYSAVVQVYSERLSPSVYFNATQTPLAKQQLFNDLKTHKPDLVAIPLSKKYTNLIDTDIRSQIINLVAKGYYEDTCIFKYKIYRRIGGVSLNNRISFQSQWW